MAAVDAVREGIIWDGIASRLGESVLKGIPIPGTNILFLRLFILSAPLRDGLTQLVKKLCFVTLWRILLTNWAMPLAIEVGEVFNPHNWQKPP
jgi:hypothetical protein